jgi:urease accessory protein
VAGGDRLKLNVDVGAEAHALLTTPGAGKWYKANGKNAAQHNSFYVQENAVLEWLPQESIVYDAARVTWHTRVDLANTACYTGWEITCLGRKASGEEFREGNLKQSLQIFRANRLIWGEHGNLIGGDKLLTSAAGLRGCSVTATFVIAAGKTDAHVLEKCRSILPVDEGFVGVSALPEIFVARYLGHSAQAARQYFEEQWKIMRPLCAGVNAQRPRIWNT